MKETIKKNVTEFLHDNYDIIAHSPANIKRVSRDVIEYRLNMNKKARVVK